jgi:plastocyanin
MTGALGIGTAALTPPPPPTTTTATGTPCSGSAQTTVNVEEFDYGFRLSQSTIPCGTITFVMKNTGTVPHDFVLYGVTPAASGAGPVLDPGATKSMTVTVTRAGSYDYLCDLPHHADLGMVGKLTVTP